MSEIKLTTREISLLQETFNADYKSSNIRLREGEHQYAIAKTIASFQLQLSYPDVKEIVKRLYNEEKTGDIQLVRKVQTILKKMEKSSIVKILPKKKPWELQRYALYSFKFQDSDKNLVALATEEQIKQAQNLLDSTLTQQQASTTRLTNLKAIVSTFTLAVIIISAYALSTWGITRPSIDLTLFILGFAIAVTASILLGKILSRG